MMLIEQTSVPTAALPVQELKDHLRLGTGFADDDVQDGVLGTYLRAALAAIEARTGKILLERSFAWSLTEWRGGNTQGLPVGPISSVSSVVLTDANDQDTTVSPDAYHLAADLHRPLLKANGSGFPSVPASGSVTVSFVAGFGPDWNDVPADLQQAVCLLATQFYEFRQEPGGYSGGLPFGVEALIARYRNVRISKGGAT